MAGEHWPPVERLLHKRFGARVVGHQGELVERAAKVFGHETPAHRLQHTLLPTQRTHVRRRRRRRTRARLRLLVLGVAPGRSSDSRLFGRTACRAMRCVPPRRSSWRETWRTRREAHRELACAYKRIDLFDPNQSIGFNVYCIVYCSTNSLTQVIHCCQGIVASYM